MSIILDHINYCYSADSAYKVQALKDVSLEINDGEFIGIIGHTGSGKSTLIQHMNGLLKATSGHIYYNGQDIYDNDYDLSKLRHKVGMVFQSFNLFPQYTALENVMLAKELLEKEQPDYKVRKKEIHDEIEGQAVELLKDMGLADRMGNYPHQLSGGQCQRVAIARALALRPDILCFDEPTSALDPELTGEVLKVIKGLADQKMTMIIVTHEMAFARDVANQVVFMDNGFIVEQGTPDQVFGHTQEERTRQFLSRFNQR